MDTGAAVPDRGAFPRTLVEFSRRFTVWTMLHKLRRAMVRPGREMLSGSVEVDETFVGGVEKGVRGRQALTKMMVAVAAEEDGRGIGRIRLEPVADGSAASLIPFVERNVARGSAVHTDGWEAYGGLAAKGYRHKVTNIKGSAKDAHEVMPRVHRVAALLKRWWLGTHQGSISPLHLEYYLDEFTFRFNRRSSGARGQLFFRLAQQAVRVDPVSWRTVADGNRVDDHNPYGLAESTGYPLLHYSQLRADARRNIRAVGLNRPQ